MDHPSNAKRVGVRLYYKCSLPLKVIGVSFLQECINFGVKTRQATLSVSIDLLAKQKTI